MCTTWKGSMAIATPTSLGWSWPLNFRHRPWEWLAIAIYGLRKRCMLIGCINSRIKNLVGGVNPSAKICSSNWIISPRDRGEKRKYVKFHHLFGKSWSKNHHSFILFHPSAPDPSAPFMSSSIASAKARSVRTSNADVASSIKHTDLNGAAWMQYHPWFRIMIFCAGVRNSHC